MENTTKRIENPLAHAVFSFANKVRSRNHRQTHLTRLAVGGTVAVAVGSMAQSVGHCEISADALRVDFFRSLSEVDEVGRRREEKEEKKLLNSTPDEKREMGKP